MASVIFSVTSYADNPTPLNKWKIGNNIVNSSTFELRASQSAVYDGDLNRGSFKNFCFKARVTHSEGAKASFWIHSDANLVKGYSILVGKPIDDHRRSGSLASVRNLYRPSSSSFNLEVKVEGKRIVVFIDGRKVVDYLEPAAPHRIAINAAQLFSDVGGLIGFRAENGTLNVSNASITTFADNLPYYPEGKEPIDERNDALIRLQQRNFPVIDYHIHPPRGMSLEDLLEKALADGFEYGIAVNCGIGFQVQSDEQVKEYISKNRYIPVFHTMQGEGREWVETFSKEAREMFDYVFTDALTFHDHKGRRTRLWVNNEVIVDIPEQEYMDMILDRTIKILNEEPIDILVNPTLLGNTMMEDYDKYWTDARVAQLVMSLKNNDIALEINARYKLPSARIINAAKAAGVKFALGTNNGNAQQLDRLEYSLKMVEECGLTIDNMWFPKGQ
jgi:hypothetical protein